VSTASNQTGNSQTANNRSENGTQEDGRSKHARSNSPAHRIPYVRNDTDAVREGRDGEETANKTRDEQSRHVVRAGLADVKDRVHRKGADKDGPPTDELRAGTPEDGAEHVADEEQGEYEVPYFPPYMKVMRDNRYRRGWRRRSECTAEDNVSAT
jgi:hypothetical protein